MTCRMVKNVQIYIKPLNQPGKSPMYETTQASFKQNF